MAKKQTTSTKVFVGHPRKKRPGRHSKKRSSNSKNAKHYTKKYRGQGKK